MSKKPTASAPAPAVPTAPILPASGGSYVLENGALTPVETPVEAPVQPGKED